MDAQSISWGDQIDSHWRRSLLSFTVNRMSINYNRRLFIFLALFLSPFCCCFILYIFVASLLLSTLHWLAFCCTEKQEGEKRWLANWHSYVLHLFSPARVCQAGWSATITIFIIVVVGRSLFYCLKLFTLPEDTRVGTEKWGYSFSLRNNRLRHCYFFIAPFTVYCCLFFLSVIFVVADLCFLYLL